MCAYTHILFTDFILEVPDPYGFDLLTVCMIEFPSPEALDQCRLGGISQDQSFLLKSNAKGHDTVTNSLVCDTVPRSLGLE